MYCYKKISDSIYWVGASDRRIALFENVYPVPDGVSYNSYLIKDEKNVLVDTVDKAVSSVFLENIAKLLNGQPLDYIIVNHMEPDHCATLGDVVALYPDVKIVCNSKIVGMIKQFFDFDIDGRAVVVAEGDTLNTGKHTFTFVMAPMVHWPEVMVTYDTTDKVLYSADAFGTFGAINGNIFADETEFDLAEARRYYTNIVGKYGPQVQALLKKAGGLEINMICPLHGPVWRENIAWYVDKYNKWSSYTPEDNSVVIAYSSIYGNTENLAEIIAGKLADKGVKNIKVYDVSVTHFSYVVSECFRVGNVVLASNAYNGGVFPNMELLVNEIAAHNIQNRTFAVVDNGSWAAVSGKKIKEKLETIKNTKVLEETVSIKSALKENQMEAVDALVDAVVKNM